MNDHHLKTLGQVRAFLDSPWTAKWNATILFAAPSFDPISVCQDKGLNFMTMSVAFADSGKVDQDLAQTGTTQPRSRPAMALHANLRMRILAELDELSPGPPPKSPWRLFKLPGYRLAGISVAHL